MSGFTSWADARLIPGTRILWVDLYGPHTEASLRAWRTEVGSVWSPHCDVYLMDYRRALLAVAPEVLADLICDRFRVIPSVALCSEAQWPLFVELAEVLAQRRVLRMAFVDEDSAVRSARLMQALGRPMDLEAA